MGTHDESNLAGPQNEFLSGFKRGVISRDKETKSSEVPQPGKTGGGIGSRKLASDLQNQAGTNPSQLTQQVSRNIRMEQQNVDSSEKKDDARLARKAKDRFIEKESGSGDIRQKVMVVMIPILFIVMVFMFRQVLVKPPKKAKGEDDSIKRPVPVTNISDADINWQIPDQIPVAMRDPIKFEKSKLENTVHETTPNQTDDKLINVRSILFSSDKPSVVIGDKIVYLNQTINGVTVMEIHRDYIVFEKDGQRWTQKISDESSPGKKEAGIPDDTDKNTDSSSTK
jgi:hypothetical protein